jgi:hypothetical protein
MKNIKKSIYFFCPVFRSVRKLLNFAPNSIGVRLTGKLMFVPKIRCCYFRESIFPAQLNVELLYIIFLKKYEL